MHFTGCNNQHRQKNFLEAKKAKDNLCISSINAQGNIFPEANQSMRFCRNLIGIWIFVRYVFYG
jgi:hypothetical protein